MTGKPSLFAELRRRNVLRVAGLYLVGAWLIVQVSGTILPLYGAPAWLPRGKSVRPTEPLNNTSPPKIRP